MQSESETYEVGDVIEGNLKLIEKIGEGGIGTVFLAQNVDLAYLKYAVKRLDKSKMDQIDKADYKREIAIMKQLSGHPNIVQYINNFETVNFFYLVMEYCETDLFDAIFIRCGFPVTLVKRFFSDIANGLAHCHQNGIYHRDIKPENVLITGDGGVAKLADFGLATLDKYTDDFGVGSSRYMAPECFGPEETGSDSGVDMGFDCYNAPAADVWSMGVVLVNLIFGRCPWHEASPTDKVFSQYITTDPYILKNNLMISEELDTFLREKVFNMEPEKRCTIQEFNDFVSVQKYFIESDSDTLVRKLEYISGDDKVTIVHKYDTNDDEYRSEASGASTRLPSLDDLTLSFLQTRGSILDLSINENHSSSLNWSTVSQFGSQNLPNKLTVSSADISSPFIETKESRVQLAKHIFGKSLVATSLNGLVDSNDSTIYNS